MPSKSSTTTTKFDRIAVLEDYRIATESRHASLLGRKEVFMGKAKFGIFGDGKELAQIALAKFFKKGDWRSGYYRDQTWMMAIGQTNLREFFAQLYAHADLENEPSTGGRLMNVHYGSRSLDKDGNWLNQMERYNSTTDMSPTSIQMARLLGLAYASKLYRNLPELDPYADNFSNKGNEIAFGSIGDGACAEGIFYETINAAGVLQVPMLCSVWDDGYAISVPRSIQTTKSEISKALEGFQRTETEKGIEIVRVKGWDYPALIGAYKYAEAICREEHVPVLVHVDELTQPQGHSTSGSHERYKSKERLKWESDFDCIKKFGQWIVENDIATEVELKEIELKSKESVKKARDQAWTSYTSFIKVDIEDAIVGIEKLSEESSSQADELKEICFKLKGTVNPIRMDAVAAVKKALRLVRNEHLHSKSFLQTYLERVNVENKERYSSHNYSQSEQSPLLVKEIKPEYSKNAPLVDGREIVNACFDNALSKDPRIFAIGEDVGQIGDVNQGFAGLQQKYGALRVTDTGIRETTIMGQGLGAAHRGLKPICEIQYLDYIIYGLEPICDDLASVHYRSKGGHKAPMIIRTRGHRLEGVWHSGSPIGMLLNCIRGIYLLVPRNMTQAAGMYNVLFKSDNPAVIIETLNSYRQKEKMPLNVGEFTVPFGVPEILVKGSDITIVTYGAMCRIALEAAEQLLHVGISAEVIDVQTLLPFDIHEVILDSIKKTNRVVFADEDVPGGASAYMMQQVLEKQNAYYYLDSPPITITAKEHRPAYASDGDYFSKPNPEEIFDKVYELFQEVNPTKFPEIYK
ncbi:MAG: thiamine pyrophosphate-dependent enzyme [Bacteroidota bacterium]|nr:thiamine pyrophosphate-dependent enzyme [Bacteroidota bacterium]